VIGERAETRAWAVVIVGASLDELVRGRNQEALVCLVEGGREEQRVSCRCIGARLFRNKECSSKECVTSSEEEEEKHRRGAIRDHIRSLVTL
jgi:hypothetical protein